MTADTHTRHKSKHPSGKMKGRKGGPHISKPERALYKKKLQKAIDEIDEIDMRNPDAPN